jgi:hypothetical protein
VKRLGEARRRREKDWQSGDWWQETLVCRNCDELDENTKKGLGKTEDKIRDHPLKG